MKCAFLEEKSLWKSECLDTTDRNLKAFQIASQPDLHDRKSKSGRGQMAGTDTVGLFVCSMPPSGPE